MSPTVTTFLFEVANFLILAGALTWLLFRPVRAAIEKRREHIAEAEQQSTEKLAEAERTRREIEQRLARLDEEIREKRDSAKQTATQEAEQIVSEARAAAQRERASLKRQLHNLEHARIENISKIVAATAGQAVGRLLHDVAETDLDGALVRQACHQLQTFDGNSLAPVIVESARELSAEERQAIENAAGPAGESVDYRITEELKMGLRISTNRGLIDLSDAGLAEYTERALASRLNAASQTNNRRASHADSH